MQRFDKSGNTVEQDWHEMQICDQQIFQRQHAQHLSPFQMPNQIAKFNNLKGNCSQMNTVSTQCTVRSEKKEANNILKKHNYLVWQCYIIDFIVHVFSHFLQYTLHCSCFISFPSVDASLFMFYLISSSSHFIDHVSFLLPSVHSPSHSFHLLQSISFLFTLFGLNHITWSFILIVSFTFQPILSLEINNLRVSLDKFFNLIQIFIT